MTDQRLQQGLGWLSVGLGLTQLTFAGGLCRLLGIRGGAGLVRLLGARDLLMGVGLLSPWKGLPQVLGRVARKPRARTSGVKNLGTYDGPMESWRGSGLAEDVGMRERSAEPEVKEAERQQRMRAAQRQLGLPDLEEVETRT